MNWLTYCGGAGRVVGLCCNVLISNDITEIVIFPTRIPDCDSYRPALLDFFLSSNPTICSTVLFPPLGNSDHVISVCIDFSSNTKADAHFNRTAYDPFL